MAFETANSWINKSQDPGQIEYLLVLSDGDARLPEYLHYFGDFPCTILSLPGIPTAIKKVNHGATHAHGYLMVGLSDDVDCPQHWDKSLLEALAGKEDFVVKTHDGLQPYIMTMPIMDRKFYERFGYVLQEEYHHWYCDNELAEVGKILGRTIVVNMLFKHNHYSQTGKGRDAVSVLNESKGAQDAQVFARRKAINFGLR